MVLSTVGGVKEGDEPLVTTDVYTTHRLAILYTTHRLVILYTSHRLAIPTGENFRVDPEGLLPHHPGRSAVDETRALPTGTLLRPPPPPPPAVFPATQEALGVESAKECRE